MCHNHVEQLIWHLNIIAQERNRTSYCHKPKVQRWTTPSSWWWRRWWCQRGWRSDRGRLRQRFLLQSLLEQPLCHVSPPPPLGNTSGGGLYIVVFRSSWAVWDEDGWHRRSNAQINEPRWRSLAGGPRHLVSFGPCGPPCWLLVLQKVLMIKYWRPKNPRSIWVWEGSWNIKIHKTGFSYPTKF
jgi:hypothetical protein